ncbi:MAG: hypothetical protein KGH88_09485 [Thaumarchaeota archaeon]|nr:hypothetical protein [Nitrososphaerota archaeon]
MVPLAAAPRPSWLEQLRNEYDLLLSKLAETRQEIAATRKEVEELKSVFKR